ncbi:hypothetical protein J1614_009548 [Plenodomus biglobosus]|nr:hypothetical protein J1614_009548 [Plenodomus biglobosus]
MTRRLGSEQRVISTWSNVHRLRRLLGRTIWLERRCLLELDMENLFWARPTGHDVETAPGVRLELSARSHIATRGSVGLRAMGRLWLVPVKQLGRAVRFLICHDFWCSH